MTNTLWLKVLCFESHHMITTIQLRELPGSPTRDRHRYKAGMWGRVGRTDRMTDTCPHKTVVFLSHISCKRHYQWPQYCCWCLKDLFRCHTVNTIRSTGPWSEPLAYPFTQTLARLCCATCPDTTSRGTSEQRRSCPPLSICNFHTEDVVNRCMIPVLKG